MKSSSSLAKSVDFTKFSKVMVSCTTFVILYVLLYCVLYSKSEGKILPSLGLFSSLHCMSLPRDEMVIHDEYYELKMVLKAAATKDKTVILATLNEAWAAPNSIFDLFLESFRIGNNTARLLNHLIVVAVDEKAYNRCQTTSEVSHCYFLKTNQSAQIAGQADFMSPHYLDIIWQRLAFLQTILTLGYNFVNTDTDVMWFRDPLSHFTLDSDLQTSCDNFNGREHDLSNYPNVGLMFVRSNNRTIKFYDIWVSSRYVYPTKHEQDVFNVLKRGRFIREIGLKVRFLDTNKFGGFCSPSRDFNKVCTMHANCCVGLGRKIADLRATLEDWKTYNIIK